MLLHHGDEHGLLRRSHVVAPFIENALDISGLVSARIMKERPGPRPIDGDAEIRPEPLLRLLGELHG